jgi:hypothetical protein
MTVRPSVVAKLMTTFAGKRVSSGQRNESPRPLFSVLWTDYKYALAHFQAVEEIFLMLLFIVQVTMLVKYT